MSRMLESLIRENLLSVFGERDAKRRRDVIARIWASNGVFVDHDGRHVGHADLNNAVEKLQQKFPGWVFTERGPLDAFHKIGRLPWNFGPPGAAPAVTGLDVVVTENDKIVALYTFVDAPEV
jgi:hypothetical protein